ncbi:MAG: hypothetical protein GY750_08130 [Lentisphaerae bacterium]|nr:hypothetical protein [Lentisphaerota bacterium]MCP4101376.1 hypothetical protein [Lentisphaerota bacterium]
MLDISRGTLRDILQELHKQGVVRVTQGRGAYIIDNLHKNGLRRFAVKCSAISSGKSPSEAMGMLHGVCSAASEIHAEALISFEGDYIDINEIIARYGSDYLIDTGKKFN